MNIIKWIIKNKMKKVLEIFLNLIYNICVCERVRVKMWLPFFNFDTKSDFWDASEIWYLDKKKWQKDKDQKESL